jgi:hypothetical protein
MEAKSFTSLTAHILLAKKTCSRTVAAVITFTIIINGRNRGTLLDYFLKFVILASIVRAAFPIIPHTLEISVSVE